MDADALVRDFWNRQGLLRESDFETALNKALGHFVDPGRATPVRTAYYLRFADVDRLDPLLRLGYKDPAKIVYPPRAVFLAAIPFKTLKGLRGWDALSRHLHEYPQDAQDLGFALVDGEPQVPSGETLRLFVTRRLGNARLEGVMDTLVQLLADALRRLGHDLGRRVGDDATPLESNGDDPEAAYNDHYEKTGYKVDIALDLDHDVPLAKQTIRLNEAEAGCLIPNLERLQALGLRPEAAWIDGGYTSFHNLAYLGVNGIRGHYHPTMSWVHRDDATQDAVERAYQAEWNHEDFRLQPTLDEQLRFLHHQGRTQLVGAYFRNQTMAEYEECPDGYLDVYHARSQDEGLNGHLKRCLDFQTRFHGQGLARADLHATTCLVTKLVVALVRAQQGITQRLSSLEGLT